MLAAIILSFAIALATIATRADAHGYLQQPEPSWVDKLNVEWVTLIDNYWDIGSGGDQVGKFKTMAATKGMSVKDVVLDMVKDKKCGNTVETGDPQPIPSDGIVKWLGSNGGGFTHTGPCEVYLNEKMVLHGDDCEEEFKGGAVGSSQTSDMPVDFSSCTDKCTLAFYWLAFQNEQWQAYVNCVPLSGGGGGESPAQTEISETSSADTESSKASKEKPEAPSTETQSTENVSTGVTPETPAAQTPSTALTPSTGEAPAAETDTKCKAPARRLRKATTTA